MKTVSKSELDNPELEMHDITYVLDDGYLAEYMGEFYAITVQEMNGEIIKFLHTYDCNVRSVGNSISIDRNF